MKLLLSHDEGLYLALPSGTALGEAYAFLRDEAAAGHNGPAIRLSPEVGRRYAESEALHHEAGYDAYMTGAVFASALKRRGVDLAQIPLGRAVLEENAKLGDAGSSNAEEVAPADPEVLAPSDAAMGAKDATPSPKAQPKELDLGGHVNRVFVMRMGSRHLALPGPNPIESRDNFLHVRVEPRFHPSVKTRDIIAVFEKFCARDDVTPEESKALLPRVYWLDGSNVHVEFPSKESAGQALADASATTPRVTSSEPVRSPLQLDDLLVRTFDSLRADAASPGEGGAVGKRKAPISGGPEAEKRMKAGD